MPAKTLMVQGSSSSAGKSLLAAGLCRLYARRGVRVAPFKSQNMSNNAAVCPDGGEIGRAQALQAAAAGIQPCVEMNPILIKPEADARSQIIVNGRAWRSTSAWDYYQDPGYLWGQAAAALERLRAAYDLVVIEGAGSPAELNLRAGDIANMRVALHAQSPVLLVGDIDRGGIFAQLLGTLWLLAPEERALVRGLVVNKFRGDPALFADGIRILEEKGGLPVLGVIPYLHDLFLPEEDAVAIETDTLQAGPSAPEIDIAVIHFPRISNFDDFDPLRAEPGVRLRYVGAAAELGSPDALILPGTKSTLADLGWLRERGLAEAVIALARGGGAVVGICGGYQMLGERIDDPQRVESRVESEAGLGLLPVATHFLTHKATNQVLARIQPGRAWMAPLDGQTVRGYEIHMGETRGSQAWLEIQERSGQPVRVPDGAITPDGRTWGCAIHGLFANDAFRRAWLESLGWTGAQSPAASPAELLQRSLDRLADVLESNLDMERLDKIVGI